MDTLQHDLDRRFLREAIALAAESVAGGHGGPFAALVVRGGEVLARSTNQVTVLNDPTAHAEVEAIRAACRRLGAFQLEGCTVYASCEPCPMCLGAIYWARPARVVFAASREDAAAVGFDDAFIYHEIARPGESRAIAFDRVPMPGSSRPFELWTALADRVDY